MKKIFALILSLPLVFSCKEYLDIKPYGKTIPKTPEEFSAILHNHLDNIDHGEGVIFGNISSIVNFECFADDLEANLTIYPEGKNLPLYIGSNLSSMQNMYEALYACIRDCNIIIGNMENDGTALSSDVLGTAHSLRGLCYYSLLRNFCEPAVNNPDGTGVPIVTFFDMEARPLRASVKAVSDLIADDYRKALEYNISDEAYRFNNDVLNALQARLYFWTGEWKMALQFAGKVLEKYPLLSGKDYSDMIESYVAKKGNMVFKSGIIITYKEADYNADINYLMYRPVGRKFVELFPEKENDIRYGLSFNKRRTVVKKPLSCIRSAEMQLIKAEALYHIGDESGALEALNELRRHRIAGVTDYTSATLPQVNADDRIRQDATGKSLTPLIYSILCERRKEMFMEGDRWYEMKRNGRPEYWVAKQGRKYTVRSFMYTFPIPVGDVILIDGMIQNPGYERTM